MKYTIYCLLILLCFSCASKSKLFYLQDASVKDLDIVNYQPVKIQPNDILNITVNTNIPEASIPYNKVNSNIQNPQFLQLIGYSVSDQNTIVFPVLGKIDTRNKTTEELGHYIEELLIEQGYLTDVTVDVSLINAKVTILGEVNSPGTYNFSEENITLFQALGYAGDLTINGKRNDILLIREMDSNRKITHIDLTSVEFMNSNFYYLKPNDVIVVNPNEPKVKSAGFIGNIGTLSSIASFIFSLFILIAR